MTKYVLVMSALLPLIAFAGDGDFKMPEADTSEAIPVPSRHKEEVIGFYSNGCILGATPFEISTRSWELANTRRNHQYGHSSLIRFVENLGDTSVRNGWGKLFVGDSSCAAGGVMHEGHASHRSGLDVDIFFRFIDKNKTLTLEERNNWTEEEQTKNEIAKYEPAEKTGELPKTEDVKDEVNEDFFNLVKAAARESEVERIFVSPPIKKKLCKLFYKEKFDKAEDNPAWLKKIRPLLGHRSHFHVRLKCPPDSPMCRPQGEPIYGKKTGAESVGCAGDDIDDWFKTKKKDEEKKPVKPPLLKPEWQVKVEERCSREMSALKSVNVSEFVKCETPDLDPPVTVGCRDYFNARNFTQTMTCAAQETAANPAKCFSTNSPAEESTKTKK